MSSLTIFGINSPSFFADLLELCIYDFIESTFNVKRILFGQTEVSFRSECKHRTHITMLLHIYLTIDAPYIIEPHEE